MQTIFVLRYLNLRFSTFIWLLLFKLSVGHYRVKDLYIWLATNVMKHSLLIGHHKAAFIHSSTIK